MLKSTYKTAAPIVSQEPSLPPGWTEHKAPTGHSYYYNAGTKQSTYNRPTTPFAPQFFIDTTETTSPFGYNQGQGAHDVRQSHGSDHGGGFRGGLTYQDRSRRRQQQDRPKKKKAIPGCEPWILVTTKLGRRFVYNPEQNESFWKFPQHVLLATFEMDRKEQEEKDKLNKESLGGEPSADPGPVVSAAQHDGDQGQHKGDDSDSYEEVEVTDDEEGGTENLDANEGSVKKPRIDSALEAEPSGPVEFNEEDIAYQLAQMGQDYGLDPGEYGDGGGEEHDTGLPLSLEDSQALFHDLLSDYAINPYTTWEKIIEEGRIIDDERYVALPNMRARKEAFTTWTTKKIQELKEKRAKEEKQDPRIPYLRFLHSHATPKLYWPEFKRKHRKEDAMKDPSLPDKDREKMYRDHINRLKQPESTRKSDLKDLLKATPLAQLHQNSTLDSLPSSILTDIRFISLPAKTRDLIIEAYISTLPAAPNTTNNSEDTSSTTAAEAEQRQKREKALRDREKMVQEEKRRIMGKVRQEREVLREEEREIEEALRVRGREGLRGYMDEHAQGIGGGGEVGGEGEKDS